MLLANSTAESTRAAAAAAMTKLSIKAKAAAVDSMETSLVLNTVLSILTNSSASKANEKSIYSSNFTPTTEDDTGKKEKQSGPTSFSTLDEVGMQQQKTGLGGTIGDSSSKNSLMASLEKTADGASFTSTERAIEVLAALVGKSQIKEEIVHGSYRVSSALKALLTLDLDVRSTAAYGLTHVLAALTITNYELRQRALAEKDITPEQYDQVQKLQRINTKDEEGNEIVEKGDDDNDSDTLEQCRRRIQRIVALNGIPVLVRLLTHGSDQTKEVAARTLRQICVDQSSRGLMIQQGGLKACCAASAESDNPKPLRLESAHAIAKTLVTTNPVLLPEHVRMQAMGPLIFLCREVASSSLQQFEALLALTNLTSCGEAEQDRLCKEKGVSVIHYLMFDSHQMVQRAATECLCNMSVHDEVLILLRQSEKVRLWLGLCEEWNKDEAGGGGGDDDDGDGNENERERVTESYQAARAASGTLAGASADEDVCKALVSENCASALSCLFQSQRAELVHRALVIVNNLIETGGKEAGLHLMEGNIIPEMAVVSKFGDPTLSQLAKDAALALTRLLDLSDAK